MSREITVVLPDGYENPSHLIVVCDDEEAPVIGRRSPNRPRSAAVVRMLEDGSALVEEIGIGPLGEIVREAGQVVRKDQARPKDPEPDTHEFRVTIDGRTATGRSDEWLYEVTAIEESRAAEQAREMAVSAGCVFIRGTEVTRL